MQIRKWLVLIHIIDINPQGAMPMSGIMPIMNTSPVSSVDLGQL